MERDSPLVVVLDTGANNQAGFGRTGGPYPAKKPRLGAKTSGAAVLPRSPPVAVLQRGCQTDGEGMESAEKLVQVPVWRLEQILPGSQHPWAAAATSPPGGEAAFLKQVSCGK